MRTPNPEHDTNACIAIQVPTCVLDTRYPYVGTHVGPMRGYSDPRGPNKRGVMDRRFDDTPMGVTCHA